MRNPAVAVRRSVGMAWRAARADDLLERSQRAPVDAVVTRPLVASWTAYRVGSRDTRTIVLRERPRTITAGWMAQLLALQVPGVESSVTVAQHIEPIPPGTAARHLSRKRAEHESTIKVQERMGNSPTEETLLALADVIESQRNVAAGLIRLFSVAVQITCEAPVDAPLGIDGRTAVRQLTDAVEDVLSGMLADCHPVDDEHDRGFLASLPTGKALPPRRTWDTTELAYSWPCIGNAVSMEPGPNTTYLGFDLHDQTPMYLDFYNHAAGPEAPTVAIIGMTGSGKTSLMQKIAVEALGHEQPPEEILVVDPKGDFRPLAAHLGDLARVVTFGGAEGASVPNLFVIGPTVPGVNAVHERIKVVTGWLDLVCATGGRGELVTLSPDERAALGSAVRGVYQEAGIDPVHPTTWTRPAPRLLECWAMLRALGSPLAARLEPFAVGEYASIFSSDRTTPTGARLVVYDTSALEAKWQHLATYMVMAEGWMRSLADRRRRLLLLDELREILGNPSSAELPGRAFAMGRSLKLMTVAGSQQVADWEVTEQGRRALNNAATIFLAKQAAGPNMTAVRARYPALTDADALFLASAGASAHLRDRRGEFMLLTRGGRARIKVDLTPLERSLFESDPDARTFTKLASQLAA